MDIQHPIITRIVINMGRGASDPDYIGISDEDVEMFIRLMRYKYEIIMGRVCDDYNRNYYDY